MLFGFDPRFLGIICFLFLLMGIYNFVIGRRRQQQALAAGLRAPWYKQLTILTGIEYLLLSLVLLLHISVTFHLVPAALSTIVIPFYMLVMLLSALVLCAMLYQGMTASRRASTLRATVTSGKSNTAIEAKEMAQEQQNLYAQKRRERRQKAAVTRRRRAGRA